MHLDRMIFNTQVYSAVLKFPTAYLIYYPKSEKSTLMDRT